MIGRLRGKLLDKKPPQLLLEVGGVGYEVEAPMSTFYQLPASGSEVILHTHLVVREDAHLLFGFASERERSLFRALLKVNGVGAKMALAILSGMNADTFARCIQENDTASLTRLPGIGKKTAERLIVEMRDRLADWQESGVLPVVMALPSAEISRDEVKDAVSALVALGYKPPEASRMVSGVITDGRSSEEIIREALKGAMKK
ncbi:Holliday junction branch migration protein RuvA [Sulfurivermis fontis]|uniref:Holliday junction branch migration protein RuvA n=1 Tax=Sulfurivermis fontis TaxID=1972068 RepID=UPI000FDBDF3A|nr:Holliday junction branch migration protein RuvA [Sulfurivermis fontis]